MKTITKIICPVIAVIAFACFALLPRAQALTPAPDGGYPGQNTAEGQGTLLHLGNGTYNTALGWASLGFNVTGNFNTGVGAATLLNSTANNNTATGAGALLFNSNGTSNTANGAFALFSNTTGSYNVALGDSALYSNISNTDNTALGSGALYLCTGGSNVAIGAAAGQNLTTGSNNVYIGAGIEGFAGDNGVCRIGSIYGATITNGTQIFVNSDNRLGTITSSKRFKQNIIPTSSASEVLYELQPVRFQYKKEIDPEGRWQFGLVAEEVEKANPDLVVRDKEGKPYSVRYDQVNAMLLNEFLEEHKAFLEEQCEVAEQQATIVELKSAVAQQQKTTEILAAQLKAQAAQIQKVSAQLQLNKPVLQTVSNNH